MQELSVWRILYCVWYALKHLLWSPLSHFSHPLVVPLLHCAHLRFLFISWLQWPTPSYRTSLEMLEAEDNDGCFFVFTERILCFASNTCTISRRNANKSRTGSSLAKMQKTIYIPYPYLPHSIHQPPPIQYPHPKITFSKTFYKTWKAVVVVVIL